MSKSTSHFQGVDKARVVKMSLDPELFMGVLWNAVQIKEVLESLSVVALSNQIVEDLDLLLDEVRIMEVHSLLP